MIVGITGAVCSGKTTLSRDLYKSLSRKYRVCLVAETVQSVVEELGVSLDEVRNSSSILEFQYEVLSKMISSENSARKTKADVILTDRTVYDWLYFFLKYCGKYTNRDFAVRCAELFHGASSHNRYDCLIVCEPLPLEPNGIRGTADLNPNEQKIQHLIISGIVSRLKMPKIYLSGSREERLKKAEEFVVQQMERRERKWF